MMRRRFASVIERMRKGPCTPKELREELKLPDRTVDTCLRRGCELKIFKRLDHGLYAWIDYEDTGEKVKGLLYKLRFVFRNQNPPLERIATLVGKPPKE